MTETQLYDLSDSLKYAMQYLRKMKQWKEGKINLAVKGCDPPRMMDDDELDREDKKITDLLNYVDGLLESDEVRLLTSATLSSTRA